MAKKTPLRRFTPAGVCGAALACAVIAIPLAITPGFTLQFDITPKLALLLAAGAAASVDLALAYRHGRLALSRPLRWFCLLLAADILATFISTWMSANAGVSWGGGNWRRMGAIARLAAALLAMAVAFRARSIRIETCGRSILWVGGVTGLYATGQYFGWDPWIPTSGYTAGTWAWDVVRPPATLGHAAYLSNFLVPLVFLGVGVVSADRKTLYRLLDSAALVAVAAGIVVGGTRSAALGIAGGAAVYFAWRGSMPRLRSLRWLAVAVVTLALVYLSPAGLRLRHRAFQWAGDARGGPRLLLWKDAAGMALTAGFTGYGPETFIQKFPRFQSVELAAAYPDAHHESPHNIVLDATIEQGVAGLSVLLGITVLGFYAAYRNRGPDPRWSGTLAAAFASAFICHQFTCFTLTTLVYYYLLAGTMIGRAETVSTRTGRRAGLLLGTLLLSCGFLLVALLYLRFDHGLLLVRERIRGKDAGAAMVEFRRATRWKPPGVDARFWYSRNLLHIMKGVSDSDTRQLVWREAYKAGIEGASRTDEPANAYYHLAQIWAVAGDARRTEENLRRAIWWAPRWYAPREALARLLFAGGQVSEAAREARMASAMSGGRRPVVIPEEK